MTQYRRRTRDLAPRPAESAAELAHGLTGALLHRLRRPRELEAAYLEQREALAETQRENARLVAELTQRQAELLETKQLLATATAELEREGVGEEIVAHANQCLRRRR